MALPGPAALAAALDGAYAGITAIVADLDDTALLGPTGCRGWLTVDLLLHVTGDAQRALIALASPADGPADVDFVSYWRGFPAADDLSAEHAQWVRRCAAAYRLPTGVARLWCDTAPAAARAAAAAAAAGPAYVHTQGHVLALADFLATLATEAVIHHLDLIRYRPDAPVPNWPAVAVALSALEGLAPSGALPAAWSPYESLLKATGRAPFDDADRRALGADADRYPLLG
jgi:hypothetical protein